MFVTLVRKTGRVTNGEKISSLLRQLGLEERCVGKDKNALNSKLAGDVDRQRVDKELAECRKLCQMYLSDAITPRTILWEYAVKK